MQASGRICRQVREQFELVFMGEFNDPDLLELEVLMVRELGPGHITVWVECPSTRDPRLVLEGLERAQNYLRFEVASAIHRRRVPTLCFVVQLAGEP
jgi:ribosome-binding factor A